MIIFFADFEKFSLLTSFAIQIKSSFSGPEWKSWWNVKTLENKENLTIYDDMGLSSCRVDQNVSSIRSQFMISWPMSEAKSILYRILQNWEILETLNLFCEYFCNWQSCPSKGWLCRESSETVLKKVEIGGKNLRKHFLENISYRLFQTFL